VGHPYDMRLETQQGIPSAYVVQSQDHWMLKLQARPPKATTNNVRKYWNNTAKKENINLLNSPFSDTTVSMVRELISSRLNILGLGNGNGTLLSNISRGVAKAYKHSKHRCNSMIWRCPVESFHLAKIDMRMHSHKNIVERHANTTFIWHCA